MARKRNGEADTAQKLRMRFLGDKVFRLRGDRSRDEIVVEAEMAVGQDLKVDWLRRIEEGARASLMQWEAKALARGLAGEAGADRLYGELVKIMGW